MAEGQLRKTLVAIVALRLVVSTVLLGSAALLQWRATPAGRAWPLYVLIAATFVLTALYSTVLKPTEKRRWALDLQLAVDALVIGAIVWFTGGVTSYFSSLFVLPIITAGIFEHRRSAFLVGALSSALYALQVIAQYRDVGLPDWGVWAVTDAVLPDPEVAFYTVGTNVIGFLAVAALSGTLAGRIRQASEDLAVASSEIAELQALSQHIVSSLSMGLATTDDDGRILTFNRSAEVITGCRADTVVGLPVYEVLQVSPDLVTRLATDTGPAGGRRADYRYHRADGTEIDVGISATALIRGGARTGLVFTFQDITQLRRLERDARMQQRLAAVGEMAAGIAHEIRNPLASISGSIQLLRQELQLSAEQAQLLDIVLRESARLNETINHFLAYARPQRFSVSRLDIRRPLQATAMLLRNNAALMDGHLLDIDVPADPVWCEADENQVSQVIWNLATNALRAMPDGGRLRMTARCEAETGDAVLEFVDAGVGIPEEELDRIFQPFHSTFGGGTGLGLAIVHRIVRDYGGEIHVTSEVGVGTSVTVRLPLHASAPVAA